ncbi:CsbD family protein [Streptomyces sp. NRRL B-1677]|uniref:CsbD family protein n=1 Tax=Streptomyces klenkii TaxID=1420899 RepID=A0A3B0B5J6_9ACTN|nr:MULTISPECIES: CsbD family protein [Streptomyces]MBF6046995.1 CsbD family protein [Streptomyces sp. NRRL B-1677]RKN65947.1 CsbD family protein [Streptomyces klenkii]
MSFAKKFRDMKQVLHGRIKQNLGRATGNKRLRTEGKTDQVAGNLKQSGEKAKDAFKH